MIIMILKSLFCRSHFRIPNGIRKGYVCTPAEKQAINVYLKERFNSKVSNITFETEKRESGY